jgi:hypothetical protein
MARGETIFLGTPPGVGYCAVWQIKPGARIRLFFSVGSALEIPIGERQAEGLWRWCAQAGIPPHVVEQFAGASC